MVIRVMVRVYVYLQFRKGEMVEKIEFFRVSFKGLWLGLGFKHSGLG